MFFPLQRIRFAFLIFYRVWPDMDLKDFDHSMNLPRIYNTEFFLIDV